MINNALDPERVTTAKKSLPDEEVFDVVIECFKALAEPSRAKILYALQKKELSVRDIAIIAEISESATSHQLAYLKERHLVKAKREGVVMYYTISYQHLHNLLREAEEYADHVKNKIPDHPDGEQ
ncbi:MAG TPA: metalloregulator ArsR/SmtB family transcription factor [Candidatus Sulfotelmatobacter sp.]|jgi:DNA-binding transcriptional ArsR family regulator|nr:metalloregulator ArsR/SmtB family transcription factor [Candidatus Sulfotelmatobacter sp.]